MTNDYSTVIGLMQGSLEDWMNLGGPVDEEPLDEATHVCLAKDLMASAIVQSPIYPVSPNARKPLVDMQHILRLLEEEESSRPTILDTRGSSFAKGHIPGAIHIPYSSLTHDESSLKLKSKSELQRILQDAVGDEESFQKLSKEPVLLTCGSAVSVCHLALVFMELGFPEPRVYDGSWNEWGNDPSTPKVL